MTLDDLHNFWGTKDPKLFWKKAALHLLVGIVLGTIGPYDSSNLPNIAARFGYWISLLLFGAMISGPVARAFFPWLGTKMTDAKIGFIAFCAVLSVPIFTTVILIDVFMVNIIFEAEGPATPDTVLDRLLSMPFGVLGYLLLYGQVFVVSVMAFGAVVLLAADHTKRKSGDPEKPAGYRFLNRLPAELGQNLLCLSMEDHYVRAHTDKGNSLVLMRMSDAMEELSDYPGTQTHRSWWVAYAAIKKVSKEKRRHLVHLHNGIEAPVSQTYVEKLREKAYIL